jgi:hypothetical protein
MKTLNKIQKELKAPKGQTNDFGKYKYRSCEDILEAVKPLLGDCMLTLSDEIVMLGDRFYVKATATLFTDDSDKVSVSAFARESFDKKGMDSAQITGAASSYARKYALNGLFCIDDTKDADTKDNTEEAKAPAKPAVKADPFKVAEDAIKQCTTPEQLSKIGEKVTAHATLTEDQKAELYEMLEARASLI